MAIYTVHLPPDADSRKARFIAEGVNFAALFLAPIWLIWHRLWLALAAYLAFALAIAVLAARFDLGPVWPVIAALPAFYLFVEGNQFVRSSLDRRGWRFFDVIEAGDRQDAETRFYSDVHVGEVAPVGDSIAPATRAAPVPRQQPAFGMFPE